MKKSTLAKRLDRVEKAVFGQATDGAGDDMGEPTHPDADTIAWACERMQRHANSMRNFGAVVDRRDVASDLEYIAERLSGGADGGLL